MESVPNTFPSLFAGYTALWSILGVYIVYLGIRLRRAECELEKK